MIKAKTTTFDCMFITCYLHCKCGKKMRISVTFASFSGYKLHSLMIKAKTTKFYFMFITLFLCCK